MRALAAAIGCALALAAPAAASSPRLAATSTNTLAFQLLPQLGSPTQNVVFSPYSIETALAMADAGTAGATASQMNRVLSAPNAQALDQSNRTLAQRLARDAVGPTRSDSLDIANRMWVQSGLALEAPFTRALDSDFGAAPEQVGFESQPAKSRQTINKWVAAHTGNEIRNVLPRGSITTLTRLVLADALYLKAHWRSPFSRSATKRRPFFLASGKSEQVEFMSQREDELGYASSDGYQAVNLPYDSRLSLLVVMPSAGTLASYESTLNPHQLDAIAHSLTDHYVNLGIPRFSISIQESLNTLLKQLGLRLAFTDRANFSRITHQQKLKISHVEHAARLRVDENGTVAAASTVISLTGFTDGPRLPIVTLHLDHPFLFFLRDDSTGAILFAGRVVNPAAG